MRRGWVGWSFWLPALLEAVSVAGQDSHLAGDYYEETSLLCEDEFMEYSLQTLGNGSAGVRLSVQDTSGAMAPLSTNASCGIWVMPESEGLLLYVRYDACYTDTNAGFHTLTIFLESNITGEWEVYQREVLRCPVTAMDAPTPSECSNVLTESRMACDGQPASQDLCLKSSCCYDPMDFVTPCYYGNKVTVQCTREGRFSVAISKNITVPPLILPLVKLLRGNDPECGPAAQNNMFIYFNFSLLACGTIHTEDDTSLVYENDFVADKDIMTGRSSSISRDGTFRLHIRCSFAARDSAPLSVEVLTLAPPLPADSAGSLTLEMRIAKDSNYGQYYAAEDYPISKFLRDPVYLEVRILNRNDPNLLMKLKQCWATNSEKHFNQPQWPILVDGCPFAGDSYMTQAVNISDSGIQYPQHYKRFIVSTFTFVDSVAHMALGGLVYFHCSVLVCAPSAREPCVTSCPNRRKRALENLKPVMFVSSQGPVVFYVHKNIRRKEGNHESGHTASMGWMLVIAAGSISGVILVLVILLIKVK